MKILSKHIIYPGCLWLCVGFFLSVCLFGAQNYFSTKPKRDISFNSLWGKKKKKKKRKRKPKAMDPLDQTDLIHTDYVV